MNAGRRPFEKRPWNRRPTTAPVRFNLAITQFLNGNFIDSTANLKQVVGANKNDGDAYYVLAKAQNELKQDGSESTRMHGGFLQWETATRISKRNG
jgi:predicted Zn-dependent protease